LYRRCWIFPGRGRFTVFPTPPPVVVPFSGEPWFGFFWFWVIWVFVRCRFCFFFLFTRCGLEIILSPEDSPPVSRRPAGGFCPSPPEVSLFLPLFVRFLGSLRFSAGCFFLLLSPLMLSDGSPPFNVGLTLISPPFPLLFLFLWRRTFLGSLCSFT